MDRRVVVIYDESGFAIGEGFSCGSQKLKINVDEKILGLDGVPLKNGNAEATLKSISIEALMGLTPDDQNTSGEQKLKRYELAVKINAGCDIEMTPEEASMLKQRIGVCYGPAVVGPAYKLLNG